MGMARIQKSQVIPENSQRLSKIEFADRWWPYKLHMNEKMDSRVHFELSRTAIRNKKTYTHIEESIHFDEVSMQ